MAASISSAPSSLRAFTTSSFHSIAYAVSMTCRLRPMFEMLIYPPFRILNKGGNSMRPRRGSLGGHGSTRVRRRRRDVRDRLIREHLERAPRPTYRDVAAAVGCSLGTVADAAARLGLARGR